MTTHEHAPDHAPPPDYARALALAIVVVGLVVATSLVLNPRLISHPVNGNGSAAIGALKTIATAQSLFREGDKDGNDTLDYAASLQELADQSLITTVLGSGTKQGYLFEVTRSPAEPEFRWAATARPALPGETGDRWFATNHEGVTFYTTAGPIAVDPVTCEIPPGPRPLGQ